MAFFRSFMRSYLSGVGFNTRGMQNIGLSYAIQPGLKSIYPDPKARRIAQKRYIRHYQSHPFWTPCMLGILLHMETAIAAKRFPPKMLSKVKDTTSYTLSALGDSFFSGSLLILWALLSICLILSDLQRTTVALSGFAFIALQSFRWYSFNCGVHQGFKFLERLKRWDLINWGRRIKYVNAALLVWLWWLIWPQHESSFKWLLGTCALMLFGRCMRTGMFSRVIIITLFIISIEMYPRIEPWVHNLL